MKTTLFSFSFILLAWVLGCKKPPLQDDVDPNPPQPPANCRIIRTTYKHPTIGLDPKSSLIIEPETITLDDGEKIQVSFITKTTYEYDNQRRIIEVSEQLLEGDYRLTKYIYTSTTVMIDTETLAHQISNKPYTLRDTIQLNEQGLISRQRGLGDPYLLYNTDKQPIGTSYHPDKTHVYENGNLKEVIENASWIERNGQLTPTDYMLRHFSYNIDRPNLPLVYQFRGQLSRNLPIKEVWEMHQSSQFPDGPVYQKIYTYTYDKLGRVKRRVVNGKALNPGWLIEDDTYGVGVTDYEYECP